MNAQAARCRDVEKARECESESCRRRGFLSAFSLLSPPPVTVSNQNDSFGRNLFCRTCNIRKTVNVVGGALPLLAQQVHTAHWKKRGSRGSDAKKL